MTKSGKTKLSKIVQESPNTQNTVDKDEDEKKEDPKTKAHMRTAEEVFARIKVKILTVAESKFDQLVFN
jgi:hypothetical protein